MLVVTEQDKMTGMTMEVEDNGDVTIKFNILKQNGVFSSNKPRAASTGGNRYVFEMPSGVKKGWVSLNSGLS